MDQKKNDRRSIEPRPRLTKGRQKPSVFIAPLLGSNDPARSGHVSAGGFRRRDGSASAWADSLPNCRSNNHRNDCRRIRSSSRLSSAPKASSLYDGIVNGRRSPTGSLASFQSDSFFCFYSSYSPPVSEDRFRSTLRSVHGLRVQGPNAAGTSELCSGLPRRSPIGIMELRI